MNSFCMYCTGYVKDDVKECEDAFCPFHPERRADLPWQLERKEKS